MKVVAVRRRLRKMMNRLGRERRLARRAGVSLVRMRKARASWRGKVAIMLMLMRMLKSGPEI